MKLETYNYVYKIYPYLFFMILTENRGLEIVYQRKKTRKTQFLYVAVTQTESDIINGRPTNPAFRF